MGIVSHPSSLPDTATSPAMAWVFIFLGLSQDPTELSDTLSKPGAPPYSQQIRTALGSPDTRLFLRILIRFFLVVLWRTVSIEIEPGVRRIPEGDS